MAMSILKMLAALWQNCEMSVADEHEELVIETMDIERRKGLSCVGGRRGEMLFYEGKVGSWYGTDIRVRARPERYGELVLDAVLREECRGISDITSVSDSWAGDTALLLSVTEKNRVETIIFLPG